MMLWSFKLKRAFSEISNFIKLDYIIYMVYQYYYFLYIFSIHFFVGASTCVNVESYTEGLVHLEYVPTIIVLVDKDLVIEGIADAK